MITALHDFFIRNLDIVFLVYGAAYIIMGVFIFAKQYKNSYFKLSQILWILALFGITHGINEWLDMITIIKGYSSSYWKAFSVMVLTISYIFLFEFGRRLVFTNYKKLSNALLILILTSASLLAMGTSPYDLSIWPRYLLGLPGGLLTALGFILYYQRNSPALKLSEFRKYFFIAAISTFFYSIFGGIVTPKAPFFPAKFINYSSFLDLIGIPVQVFRTLCAIILTWSVYHIMHIFDWEIMSELKSSLQEVTSAKSYVENILKSMIDALIVFGNDTKIRSVNNAACEILKYKKKELVGKTAKELFDGETPFEETKLEELTGKGYLKSNELVCLSKDNAKVPMLFSESVIKDQKDEMAGILVVGKDMREIKEMQEKLLTTEKLAAMGKVSGVIGHEIKNQLGTIRNSVYFIKMRSKEKDEKIRRHFDILENVVIDINNIIDNILNFSKTKQPEFRDTVLKDILLNSIKNMEFPENIKVTTHIEDGIPKIHADAIQLNQVFINILSNAILAMQKGGSLTISAGGSDGYVNIKFEDTGIGIKEENKPKLFELFFSTKSKGMGLGLATSKTIIEAHRGEIHIESQENKGTCVTIRLPINL